MIVHNKFAFMNYTDGEHWRDKNNNIAGLIPYQKVVYFITSTLLYFIKYLSKVQVYF